MALRQNLRVADSRLKENERLMAVASERPTAALFTIAIMPARHFRYLLPAHSGEEPLKNGF
jgi:hypothetical protein